jgi:hypothetical protein
MTECWCRHCVWWQEKAAAAERERLRGEWDDLANILMDMRVDSPLWKPPSTLNYRQASQELARRILHDFLEDPEGR